MIYSIRDPKHYFIYQIKNLITGRVYIGCSSQLDTRIPAHFFYLKKGRHHPVMCEDYVKHGEKSFVFGILAELKLDRGSARHIEKYLIKKIQPEYNRIKTTKREELGLEGEMRDWLKDALVEHNLLIETV